MTLNLMDPLIESEYQAIRRCAHRQILANGRKRKEFQTTIGAISATLKITPARIADHMDDAYLIILTKRGDDMATWIVEEDGE